MEKKSRDFFAHYLLQIRKKNILSALQNVLVFNFHNCYFSNCFYVHSAGVHYQSPLTRPYTENYRYDIPSTVSVLFYLNWPKSSFCWYKTTVIVNIQVEHEGISRLELLRTERRCQQYCIV